MTLRRRVLLALFTLFFLFAARQRSVRHPSIWTDTPPPVDRFTSSEPDKIQVHHVALDLTVDFEQRRLRGSARLELANRAATSTLILDTAGLNVTRITRDGVQTTFEYGAPTQFGTPLVIDITPSTSSVTIEYSTSTSAGGLEWNTAAQSYGRVQPYLYTLNEPVDARSWIPIQDTPSTRMTYEATIRVPNGLLALMSAGNNPRAPDPGGVYRFTMTQRIPAYLIALAVGRLEYHAFDARTGVYAEPELMNDAKHELRYMPDMLRAAERILGPHPFPRHDVLLMPPTFIVGGMEHPMLNFIHPFSAVTGNHPAVPEPKSLLAHELAHSWAGDATTLATWDDIWLNEGVTSYLTLRILEEMVGTEPVELTYFFDRNNFESTVRNTQNPSSTILHQHMTLPWTGFGATSYVKGGLFLRTLEDVLGRGSLDSFLRAWFARHSFRWADDVAFVELLRDTVGAASVDAALVQEWIYSPGLPANLSAATRSAIYERVHLRAASFRAGATMASLAPQTWLDIELELFLQSIPLSTFRDRAAEIDAAFGLSLRNAPGLTFLTLAIQANYAPANAAIERGLMRGGGNGFITSLYTTLSSTTAGRTRAREIFQRARDRYHPSVVSQVDRLLQAAEADRDAA